jgi:hypothetical protein
MLERRIARERRICRRIELITRILWVQRYSYAFHRNVDKFYPHYTTSHPECTTPFKNVLIINIYKAIWNYMDDKKLVYFRNGFSYKHETARNKFKVARNLMYQPRMGLRSLGEENGISSTNGTIGRAEPIPWPRGSPDLTPRDFFLHVKDQVYQSLMSQYLRQGIYRA